MPVDAVFSPNGHTLGLCAFTRLFAAFAIAVLVRTVRAWRLPMNAVARWHSLFVAACRRVAWPAANHLLGLRTEIW